MGSGGGGIYSDRMLTLTRSTLIGNSVVRGNGGGILNHGTLTLVHSTVIGNSAQDSGGGIYSDGMLTLIHSIVTGNSAEMGGGIANGGHFSNFPAAVIITAPWLKIQPGWGELSTI